MSFHKCLLVQCACFISAFGESAFVFFFTDNCLACAKTDVCFWRLVERLRISHTIIVAHHALTVKPTFLRKTPHKRSIIWQWCFNAAVAVHRLSWFEVLCLS